MKKWILALALFLLAGLAVVAADRVAMFTEVSGAVLAGEVKARTLMALGTGAEVLVPEGARATLTFFRDGHRERLQGPCRVRLASSGSTLMEGRASACVRTAAAPSTLLAPSGQNLRRMGGGLQALADPDSEEHSQVLALATFLSVGAPEGTGPTGGGAGGSQPPVGSEQPRLEAPAPPPPPPAAAPSPSGPALLPEVSRAPGAEVVAEPEPASEPEPCIAPAPGSVDQPDPVCVVAPAPAPPPPPLLSQQRVYAVDPLLSWSGSGRMVVLLEQGGQTVWLQACEGTSVTLPATLPAGDYLWSVMSLDTRAVASAEITLLSACEGERVRRAFRETRQMGDASAWVLLMSNLADRGLLNEALRANEEALKLQPEDSTLHLAAARLLWQLAREEEAREHAIRGVQLEYQAGQE